MNPAAEKAPPPTLAELWKGAARPTEEDQADRTDEDVEPFAGLPVIRKRLLAALGEEAFAGPPSRGLAYPQEPKDLCRWLSDAGVCDNAADCDPGARLLAIAGAGLASEAEEPAKLHLARTIARYLLREYAGTAADVLHPESGHFDAEGQLVPASESEPVR